MGAMTHNQIRDGEVIERYVLHKLPPAERQAFQEHFFECDECFEETNVAARFIAGVREASRSGLLAGDQTEQRPRLAGAAVFNQWWRRAWLMPALAACLLLAFALIGLWALSLRRENQLLAQRAGETRPASEQQRTLEARIRELEASDSTSQAQKESLRQEINRLKEQLAATERQRESHVAQLREPDVNVPVRNIYPVGEVERSGRAGDSNQLRVPRGTRTFVLILGDYKSGYSNYHLEVRDPSGRLVAKLTGLKPDENGELSVLLNRTLLSRGKYKLKLYGGGKPVGEYAVRVE
jgi:hypothetical protein